MNTNVIEIRPYQFMCLICRLGRKKHSDYYFEYELDKLQATIRANVYQPLMLCCNVESTFRFQNPGKKLDTPEGDLFNLRRDLTILQRLGLTPGGMYSASDLLRLFVEEIKDCKDICGAPPYAAKEWKGCKFACSGNYERGRKIAVKKLLVLRPSRELTACKKESAEEMYKQEILEIRPHHLLCMICFAKGRKIEEMQPIAEDHLFEALEICRKNPNIPIKLVSGPCMICTPCYGFDPRFRLCSATFAMGLRDQKKDLDFLRLLGLKYGDIMPAVELNNLIAGKIENFTSVCGFNTARKTGPAWTICNEANSSKKPEGFL